MPAYTVVVHAAPFPLPPEFSEPLSRLAARSGRKGARVLWYPEIPSTNDVAARLADNGAEEGLVVAADAQTAGRGRLGRAWASPPGAGIYASVLLRPGPDAARVLTLAAGVALAEGIEASAGLAATIKWPNDLVVVDGAGPGAWRKLAGILAEGGGTPEGGSWVVLGFGINVRPAAYPPDVAARAASLEAELGRVVDRGLVLAECLAALAQRYAELRSHGAQPILEAWRRRASVTFGRRVEWQQDGELHQGVAHGIDEGGALVVARERGTARVIAGEVRWI